MKGARSSQRFRFGLWLAAALILCVGLAWMVWADRQSTETTQSAQTSQQERQEQSETSASDAQRREIRRALGNYDYFMYDFRNCVQNFYTSAGAAWAGSQLALYQQRYLAMEAEMEAMTSSMTEEELQEYQEIKAGWHEELDPYLADLGIVSGED